MVHLLDRTRCGSLASQRLPSQALAGVPSSEPSTTLRRNLPPDHQHFSATSRGPRTVLSPLLGTARVHPSARWISSHPLQAPPAPNALLATVVLQATPNRLA